MMRSRRPIPSARHRQPIFNAPPVTIRLAATLVIMHLALVVAPTGIAQTVQYWLAFIPAAFALGEPRIWTVVTYALLHANLFHVLVNAAMLMALGSYVERAVGGWTYLLIFVLCTAGGAVAFWLLGNGIMIGASGGVTGLLGATAVLIYRRRFVDPRAQSIFALVAIVLALNFGMALFGGGGIAWQAHLGGLAAGVAYGYAVLGRRPPGGRGGPRFTIRG